MKKKIVVNSRFGRFLHGFQETFPHRKRKMLNAYFKFVQQSDFTFFFVLINFVKYDYNNDLKFFLNILLASMKTTFFLLESIFCALSNEILHSLHSLLFDPQGAAKWICRLL